MNITEPFRRLAQTHRDDVAVIDIDGRKLSFGALDHSIERMALQARRLGLNAGDLVGLEIGPDDCLASLVMQFALARIGVTTASPMLPAETMRVRFGTQPGMIGLNPGWLTDAPAPDDAIPGPMHEDGSAMLRVFHTSGTSGTPKFVPIRHDLMAQRVLTSWREDNGEQTVYMLLIRLDGSSGMRQSLATLWHGGTLVLAREGQFYDQLVRHGVTCLSAAPFGLSRLLEEIPQGAPPPCALASIRVGGARLPPKMYEAVCRALCSNIRINMGSTECGSITSAWMSELMERDGSAGYLVEGVEVEALDAQGIPLPPGIEGQLRVRSPSVVSSYFNGETLGNFKDGWFITGDIGTVWPDGRLSLRGRTTNVINIGGLKINPAMLEMSAMKLPGVQEAAAFAVPDELGLERIWLALEISEKLTDEQIEAHFGAMSLSYQPDMVMQFPSLPRNERGKIDRKRLLDGAVALQNQIGPDGEFRE